jgi:hypothetical protein
VGRGGALGALDQRWEAAVVAVNGEQKLRQRSGEVEREEEKQCKCGCGNARVGLWGTPGRARGPEEGTVARAGAGELGGARGSSGDGGATWRGREGCSAGWGAAARVMGRHVAPRRAARGRPVLGTWPVKVAGVGRRENRGGGSWR